MSEVPPPTPDTVANPEHVRFNPNLFALQARLLLGGEALNSKNRSVPDVTADQLRDRASRDTTTYTYLAKASTNERETYWQERNVAPAEQKAQWVKEVTDSFQKGKAYFKQNGWNQVFSRLQIDAATFTPADAEKLYTTYFNGQTKESEVQKFIGDVLHQYADNQAQLTQDLPALQWLAKIFGNKGSEAITHLTLAEARNTLKTEQDSLITKSNEKGEENGESFSRTNRLEQEEIETLDYVYQGKELATKPRDEQPTAEHPDWEKLSGSSRIKDEETQKNVKKIREVFTKSEVAEKGLPVYYPGAAADIVFALAFTDATDFVFDDFRYIKRDGTLDIGTCPDTELTAIGGNITSSTTEGILGQGGKRIITFEWGGKTRKITMYAEDASLFFPDEIKNGSSMVIIKAPSAAARGETPEEVYNAEPPGTLLSPEIKAKILQTIAVGGFYNLYPTRELPAELVGFKKIIDVIDEEKEYPLYQKITDEQNTEPYLQLDSQLYDPIFTRNGVNGRTINNQTFEEFKTYVDNTRKQVETLPPEMKEKVMPALRALLASETIPPKDKERLLRFGESYGLTNEQKIKEYWKQMISIAESVFPELKPAQSPRQEPSTRQIADTLLDYSTGRAKSERIDLSAQFGQLVTSVEQKITTNPELFKDGEPTIILSDVAKEMISRITSQSNGVDRELGFALRGVPIEKNGKVVYVAAFAVPSMDYQRAQAIVTNVDPTLEKNNATYLSANTNLNTYFHNRGLSERGDALATCHTHQERFGEGLRATPSQRDLNESIPDNLRTQNYIVWGIATMAQNRLYFNLLGSEKKQNGAIVHTPLTILSSQQVL